MTIGERSNLRAALWMAGSVVSFLILSVAGRAATARLDVFQVMELRSLIGLAFLWPLVLATGGLGNLRTTRPLLHLGRNTLHYGAQYAWLLALGLIPLAQMISIEFTTPFWAAILAVVFLRERIGRRQLGAIALGIAGVAVIVRPGTAPLEPGHLIMLACAVGFACSIVMVKALTGTEPAVRILFWMLLVQSLIGLVPAILVWRSPPPDLWPAIAVIAFTGTFSQYCLTKALSYAQTSFVMPIDFSRVPLSALIGWLLYDEQIDVYTALGALLIVGGNLLNLPRRPGGPTAPGDPPDGSPDEAPQPAAASAGWIGVLLVCLQFVLLGVLAVRAAGHLDTGTLPPDALLAFAGAVALGLWALSANRPGNFNIRPVPHATGRLVENGPYRWIRHPMYSALLLAGFAAARVSVGSSAWVALAALALVLMLKSAVEERALLDRHPGYRDYRRRTRRFVPWVF